jgi:hypothetical protein
MTFTMSKRKADQFMGELHDRASDILIDPQFDYSGRGMMGKPCVGFITDNSTKLAMTVAVVLAEWEQSYDDQDLDYDFPMWYRLSTAQDRIAFDTILYFPNWRIEG